MKKIVLLLWMSFIGVSSYASDRPTLTKRLVRIVKHTTYGSVTASGALLATCLLATQDSFRNSFYFEKLGSYENWIEELYCLGISKEHSRKIAHSLWNIGDSQTTTLFFAGSAAVLGLLTLYNAYKVVDTVFDIIESRD